MILYLSINLSTKKLKRIPWLYNLDFLVNNPTNLLFDKLKIIEKSSYIFPLKKNFELKILFITL